MSISKFFSCHWANRLWLPLVAATILFISLAGARSITKEPSVDQFRCEDGSLITSDKVCDGVYDCVFKDDEAGCQQPVLTTVSGGRALPLKASPIPAGSGPASPRSTTTTTKKSNPKDPDPTGPPQQEQIYLWLPLIAVVVFTGIMVLLILIGRNRDRNSPHGYTDRITDLAAKRLRRRRPEQAFSYNSGENVFLGNGQHPPLLALSQFEDSGTKDKIWTVEISAATRTTTTESSTTIKTTTTTHHPKTTTTSPDDGDGGLGASNSVDIVSIVTVMVIFCVTLVVCMVLGCKSRKSSRQSAHIEQVSLTEENSNPGYEESDTGGRPSTPPPSYSVIERQTSYASYISQSSSQMSVPPDYDEAVELPSLQNGRHRPRQSSAPNIRRSRSNRAAGAHRIRVGHNTRLFSRSISATESGGDRFRSLTSTAEAGEAEIEAAQNPSLPRNSSEPVTETRPRITSDESVFIDTETGHSVIVETVPSPAPNSPTEDSAFAPQPENLSTPMDTIAPANHAHAQDPSPSESSASRSSGSAISRSGSSPSRSASPSTPEAQDSANASAFALLGNGEDGSREGPNSTTVSFYVAEEDAS